MLCLERIKKGQSIIEYALLVAIVAAAFIAMHTYFSRSVQSRLKQVEDDMNQPTVIVR
jgi:Flp pilus assembly pilin Flp